MQKTIEPGLDDSVLWEGNFFMTATPYNLHIDTGNPALLKNENMIPGRQFIIPLWICHTNKTEAEPECGTAIFKNRFLMYGTNFAKGDARYDTNVFYTVRDYSALECYDRHGNLRTDVDWNKPIGDDIHKKYFSHYKKEWLDGFEIEGVYNWKRGGIIAFDRCQAHSGINFLKNGVTLKCGLALMTTVRKN